jgi:DNA repair exonuclease SbcCD nuclease subunit
MPDRPFRFLHSADFRLDQVIRGLAEVPDHLRDCLLDAPYTAARRVFDAAISERVAFVLLSGNIVQPDRAGPRGTAFLIEQFERLATAGIDVYWAASETDRPEALPASLALPRNVHVFARDHIGDYLHTGDGPPLARIVGTSRGTRSLHPSEFVPDPVGMFSIAVACGEMDVAEMQSQGIHYWALGGRAERTTLFEPARAPVNNTGSPASSEVHTTAHYPGKPQGRGPAESGSRGCTLVTVDESARARLSFVPCVAVEWRDETITVGPSVGRDELEGMCAQRIRALAEHSKSDLLVKWSIAGSGPILTELRRGKLRAELLEWLRIEHGLSSPFVWSVGTEPAPGAALPASLYEQETILGDYVRSLREFELDPTQPLEVESLLAGRPAAESFAHSVAITDAATRKRVLHEAAVLGVDLLSGETAEP